MRRGIALAGSIIMDYYKYLDLYPQPSQLTTIRSVHEAIGGAVCNCGMDLARIDPELPLYAYGLVGEDEPGDAILREMGAFPNLNCEGVWRSGRTSFTDVMEDASQHTRTFFHFRGANALLRPEHFSFEDFPAEILHAAYILLLDGLDEADPEYGTAMARVLARAQAAGIKTSIDVVSEASERFKEKVLPALKYTDYCIINEFEASQTTGIAVRDAEGHLLAGGLEAALRALKAAGVRRWAVIHAREGAMGLDEDGRLAQSPSLELDAALIKSTTGAGDAFLAGVLYEGWRGGSLREGIELGIATAAASLLHPSSTGGVRDAETLRLFYRQAKKGKTL